MNSSDLQDVASGEIVDRGALDTLEMSTLSALVQQARSGNATAASQALLAIQRIREKGAASLHRAKLADNPVGMAAYLASLGLDLEETARRLGHKLTRAEQAAWKQAQEDRLLEVRAIELQRMQTTGDVPKWATRRH